MNIYLIYKLIHIFAAIVFLGNIYTGLFWIHQAHKTGNLAIIHNAFESLIKSDKYFTLPGILLIIIAGIGAAIQAHYSLLRTGWIFWSIVLFSASGVVFGWKLIPIQKKIYQLTLGSDKDNFPWKYHNSLYHKWWIWGIAAIAAPIIAMVLMILKWPVKSIF